MLRIPNKEDVENLQYFQNGKDALVTIYISTSLSVAETNKTHYAKRLDQVVLDVKSKLDEFKVHKENQAQYLNLLTAHLKQKTFLKNRDKGVALFLTPNRVQDYDLPIDVDDLNYVGLEFILTPLIVVSNFILSNFVLYVGENNIQLFSATTMGIKNITNINKAKISYEIVTDNYTKKSINQLAKYLKDNEIIRPTDPLIIVGKQEFTKKFRKNSYLKNIIYSIQGNFDNKMYELEKGIVTYLQGEIDRRVNSFSDTFFQTDDSNKEVGTKATNFMRFAELGKIETLAINIFDATRKSLSTNLRTSTKIDLNLKRSVLKSTEQLVQSVFANRGGVVGTFVNGSGENRRLHAIFRSR